MVTNHADSRLKKYFYSGVGMAANTNDFVKKTVSEIAKKNNSNESDGHKIVAEAMHKIETSYNGAIVKLGKLVSSEMSRLQSRINKLEKDFERKELSASRSANKAVTRTVRTAKTKRGSAKKASRAKIAK